MLFKSIKRVTGTGRVKPTMISQIWTYQVLVASNYGDGNFLHRFVMFFQCASRESYIRLLATF